MASFAKGLLDRLNYETEMYSSKHAITNLKKINPRLNETDIFTMAYLSVNPAIPEEERNIYKQCLTKLAEKESKIAPFVPSTIKEGGSRGEPLVPPTIKEGGSRGEPLVPPTPMQKSRDILYSA